MYTQFYKLVAQPFQLTPDPASSSEAASKRAMAHLTYGLHQGEGFIVITGEVGAGKTTLVDQLLSQLDRKTFLAAKIVTTQLSGDDLLRMVAAAFGVDRRAARRRRCCGSRGISSSTIARRAARAAGDRRGAEPVVRSARGTAHAVQHPIGERAAAAELPARPAAIPRHCSAARTRPAAPAHHRVLPSGTAERGGDRRPISSTGCARSGWNGDPRIHDDCLAADLPHTGGVPRRINTLCSRVLLYRLPRGAAYDLRPRCRASRGRHWRGIGDSEGRAKPAGRGRYRSHAVPHGDSGAEDHGDVGRSAERAGDHGRRHERG